MITGFEKYTAPLEKSEEEWVPYVVSAFKKYAFRRDHFKKSKVIIHLIDSERHKADGSVKMIEESTLRKIINHLCVTGKLPICSDYRGYWLATSDEEIKDQIKSLTERANGILARAQGLYSFKNLSDEK